MKLNSFSLHPKRHGIISAVFLVIAFSAQSAEAEKESTLDLGADVKLACVSIQPGAFKQGSPPTETGRNADETQHDVRIAHAFLMSKYLVTVVQFARFISESQYRTEAETGPSGGFGFDGKELIQKKEYTWRNPGFKQTDAHPVVLVSWNDAVAFCNWLAKKSGRKVMLPTEAQWEYACRAGTEARFYNGGTDSDAEEIAWFKKNAEGATHPVGAKKPNEFGLFDMCGGVYQWCRDQYQPYKEEPGTEAAVDDPVVEKSDDKIRRVLRGGSFLKDARNCRSAARYRNDPRSRNADNGFRIVIELGE